jgi:magnesium transporter
MSRSVPLAGPEDTVGSLRARVEAGAFEISDPIVALDQNGLYRGVIRLAQLVGGEASRPAYELADPLWPSVEARADQEHVAELARAGRLVGVPVLGPQGRVLGVVSATRLLDVLWREHTEDMHRLAGILKPIDMARQALDDPPYVRARRRLPWLALGLVGSAIATALMAGFEATFQENVKLAFFVPAIVYLADAIGTQTEAVAVRGLSLQHRPFTALIRGEAAAGGLIGLALSLFVLVGVALAFQDIRLAVVVAFTVLVAGVLAATVGLTLPWVLSRAGADPAFGSGPIATILQDVLSIVIYLLAISVLL